MPLRKTLLQVAKTNSRKLTDHKKTTSIVRADFKSGIVFSHEHKSYGKWSQVVVVLVGSGGVGEGVEKRCKQHYKLTHDFRVYLGVKTCEVFLCFPAIIFLGSTVLTSQWLLCIHCFTSLVSFTGFYTDEDLCIQNVITKKKRKGNKPQMRMSGKNSWRSL